MKDFKIELRWALLFNLALMGWMFFEHELGWHSTSIDSQLGNHFLVELLLYTLIYYRALSQKQKYHYKGKMNWKQGMVSGAAMSVLIVILAPITHYFIYHYITPDYFQNMIDYQTSKESHAMMQGSAELLFSMKSYIFQEVSIAFAFGFGLSAILSLFIRKKPKSKS